MQLWKLWLCLGILCLSNFAMLLAQPEARLLRFPATYGDKIVFSYAGDLYLVNAHGGVARKITGDIGYEMFARFSPDGKYLAFSGQYDGNTEVYLMPAEGGVPKRLTYTATLGRDDVGDRMGPNNIVMGWQDNFHVVYRSRWRDWNDFKGQLYAVSVQGGLSEQLPLPRGGFCSFSPDRTRMAYNRVFREFRTWKRYRGGQADDIWIYDFAAKTHANITNHPAQDIMPMWYQNRIYFTSDRDGRLNLFCYDLAKQESRQITHFRDFDVKFPSLGDQAIVFENGGYIYRCDLPDEQVAKVTILLQEDLDRARGGLINVSKWLGSYEISPDGKRALFSARGELFTVPAKHGPTRNLTNTSQAHERSCKWSPDGKWIAFISDATGEDEIWIVPQKGGVSQQLTKNGDVYKYGLQWAPDSGKILYNDRQNRLQFVDIASKEVTTVAQSSVWEITYFSWAPDSKWIAYANPEEENLQIVYIYSLADKKARAVSDKWYTSYAPVFSSDGKYLYIVSHRNFAPTYGMTEWNHIYQDMAKLYLLTLTKEATSPFAPKSDEAEVKETKPEGKKDGREKPGPEAAKPDDRDQNLEEASPKADHQGKEDKSDKSGKSDKEEDKPVAVQVDFDNILGRIVEIPVAGAEEYRQLVSVADKLYYLRKTSKDESGKLFFYDFNKLAETEIGEIGGFEISADHKKMIVGQHDDYAIVDLPEAALEIKDKLNLGDMKMRLDRSQEWQQIFDESWRQMRDFFYVPNLHGVAWQQIRANYKPLVAHVGHRADLTYILGEMIGELSAGHCYVGGGDTPKAERIKLGLLGAELSLDTASRAYRIHKILPGQNWNKMVRSPLTEAGVKVQEGDFILAVDGRATAEVANIYELLVNTVGKQVRLTVNSQPNMEGSREVVVIPCDDEQPLYYYGWVQANLEKVSKATGGRVGYIHIPDMGEEGLNQFVQYFYPQLTKPGLVIDIRGNAGGYVSSMIAERLRRELAMIGIARNAAPTYNPGNMHYGAKVCLCDEFSASDGDIFAYRFKFHKLGKVIGKRTWGGVVGIRDSLPFVDGGYLFKPEFSQYDIQGKEWMIEGVGVEPDIVVDNDPAQEFMGVDAQLDKAIAVIVEELSQKSFQIPAPPAYPDKSK